MWECWIPLEVELQTAVSCHEQARLRASTFNHWVLSPTPAYFIFNRICISEWRHPLRQISWSWSYRQLWVARCGCLERNLGLLQKKYVILAAEPYLQSLFMCFHVWKTEFNYRSPLQRSNQALADWQNALWLWSVSWSTQLLYKAMWATLGRRKVRGKYTRQRALQLFSCNFLWKTPTK